MDERLSADFPIDWLEDQYVSRREFVKFLTLASGAMALASGGLAAWSRVPRHRRSFARTFVARIADLQVGDWLQFSYPRPEDRCILIRTADDTFAAFSRRCTHLSCPVVWQPQERRLFCPCHEGAFSVEDGRVLQGPPARSLPQIELAIADGSVYATGVRSGDS